MNTPTGGKRNSDFLSDLIERSYDALGPLTSSMVNKTPISDTLDLLTSSTPVTVSSGSSARKLSYQLARLQTKYDELAIHSDQFARHSQQTIQELTQRCAALEKDRKFLMAQEEELKSMHEKQINQLNTSLSILNSERSKAGRELDRLCDEWNNKEQTYLQTIAQLKAVQQDQQIVKNCSQAKEKENDLLRNEISALKEKNRKLAEELEEERTSLQPKNCEIERTERVFVLKLNPLPEEQKKLFPNNEPFPAKIQPDESGNCFNSAAGLTELQEQLASSEKKLTRLMEIFKQKIKQFREIVFLLLGYQIDLQSDGGIRLRSLYAFHEDDWIEFRRDEVSKGMKLMESPFLAQYPEELERFVRKGNSIPAFLSHVTSSLWDKSTMAI